MIKSYLVLLLLGGAMFSTLGCGSSTPRKLVSVMVTPSVADAQNFPGGQVQFVATGIYNKPPSPAPVEVSSWLVMPASLASIDQNGIAKCAAGQSGTANIELALIGDTPLMNVAKLVCP